MPAPPLRGVLRHIGLAAAQGAAGVPDSELLERFLRRRDGAAFELLVWRHGKMVLGTCRRLLRDVHDAEDAFQATFLALARRAASVGRRGSVGGWLHKVAYRLALRAKARRARRGAREQPLGEWAAAAGGTEPPAEAARREVGLALDEEVSRLPDRYRVPFVLCCLEGRSNAEVARELSCPVGTVESRLSRARQRLRDSLSRRGVAPTAGLFATLPGPGEASPFVPATLAASTAEAATLMTASQAVAAGLISAQAAALTEGVLKAMWMTKLKVTAAVVLAVALTGTGAGVLTYRAAAAGEPSPAPGGRNAAAAEAARIAQLVDRLGSSTFAERERAGKELEAIGAPALDALRQAARAGDAERRRRAEQLVKKLEERIEVARLLAPRRVRLVYRDTPLAEAVADFKAKSGYDLSLSDADGKLKGRAVTLDTGEVTFWQALGQFCRQARLAEAPAADSPPPGQGGGFGGGGVGRGPIGGMVVGHQSAVPGRIVLADGPPPAVPADDDTAVRVRALDKADAAGPPADGETRLALEVSPEPKLRWQRVVAVTVGKAIDDQGQVLEQVKTAGEGAGAFPGRFDPSAASRLVPVYLKKGPRPATSLRELSGTVTARVLKEPRPYLTVDDILGAAGKKVEGAGGGALWVLEVTAGPAGRVQLRLAIDPPADLALGGGPTRLVQRAGRAVVSGGDGDGPELEVALLDDKGAVLPPVGLGGRMSATGTAEYALTYQPQKGKGAPAKLVYSVSPSVTIDIPFALKDVRLP
jgi:RNA polymerase sigma factor (sigma-70 family)